MRTLAYGRSAVDIDLAEDCLVPVRRRPPAPALADPAAAVRAALETPLGFPPLRRALTPDDHVVVVLDEHLPHLAELLTPVLEHISEAHVAPEAITLLTPASGGGQRWIDDLPEAFEDVRVEAHDPKDRKKLSYLATTRRGRRIYVNRTAVDADQLVILCRPNVDPLLAPGGAGMLYPALGDEATRQELAERLADAAPGTLARGLHDEAAEVAWLLGAPFLVQVVEGSGDEIAHVIGGPVDTADEAERLYEARWRQRAARLVDTVVATVRGGAGRHDFADLARALAHAAPLVEPEGRIVLLSEVEPRLGPAAALLRQAGDPSAALELLRKEKPPGLAAALQWAAAARRAQVYLLSGLPAAEAEELLVTPMDNAGQTQRLLRRGGSCLILEDADKALPALAPAEEPADE
jgi:nickel-dependent lactate racemase